MAVCACLWFALLLLLLSSQVEGAAASADVDTSTGDDAEKAAADEGVITQQIGHHGNLLPRDPEQQTAETRPLPPPPPPPQFHPHRSYYPFIYYPLPPSSSSSSSHSPPSSFLYQLLREEVKALSHQRQAAHQDSSYDGDDDNITEKNMHNNDDDVGKNNKDDDDDDDNVEKRVFCNGFTGCGGRHRDGSRWRRVLATRKRLIPVLVKRPSCTFLGCLQTPGDVQPTAVKDAPSPTGRGAVERGGDMFPRSRPILRLGSQGLAKILETAARVAARAEREGGSWRADASANVVPARKRLFCNGYGGCRGRKRSLFSPWLNKMNSVADSLRRR